MEQLSEYELQRLKNIDANQAQLVALGLVGDECKLIPKGEPKLPKPKLITQSSEPIRTSTRLAGKEVPSYADSARCLDELDPDACPRKKRGRPKSIPEWYDDDDDELHRRKRAARELRPNEMQQQRAAFIAQLPSQPSKMPSREKLVEMRNAGVTIEQLTSANYPEQTIDTYNSLLIGLPLTTLCAYPLMPFEKYCSDFTGKFKVQCEICEDYYCLNKQGLIHLHSKCKKNADDLKARRTHMQACTALENEVNNDSRDPEIPLGFGRATNELDDDDELIFKAFTQDYTKETTN